MFKNNKKAGKEKVTIVTTKEQLKAAVNRKDPCIEVRGDLAKKMSWMAKLSKEKVALIVAGLTASTVFAVTAPAAAGVSVFAACTASAAASSTEVITFGAIVGGVVIVAILKGYNVKVSTAYVTLELKKHK